MEVFDKDYKKEATLLGFIDRKLPEFKKYDMGWIAGASRPGLLARVKDYEYLSTNLVKVRDNQTLILAGSRELWANIDGINPEMSSLLYTKEIINIDKLPVLLKVGNNEEAIKEGQKYLTYLANSYGIKLDIDNPFIEYKTKEECPEGRFPKRVYPNYNKDETGKLTESLMAEDLSKQFLQQNKDKFVIIGTKEEQSQRPNTTTTARDAAEFLVKQILEGVYKDQKEFVILFESNNPYIERQTLATQASVDQVLKKYGLDLKGYTIKIDGVGFANKQDNVTIHSEFGALMAEKWKGVNQTQENSLEYIKTLLFQTRDHGLTIDPMPMIGSISSDDVE